MIAEDKLSGYGFGGEGFGVSGENIFGAIRGKTFANDGFRGAIGFSAHDNGVELGKDLAEPLLIFGGSEIGSGFIAAGHETVKGLDGNERNKEIGLIGGHTVEGSTGRPRELTPAEEVDMEVRDGFAAVRAIVDGDAKALFELELLSKRGGGEEEVAKDGSVFGGGFTDARDGLAGYDEQVHGSTRSDIVEGDARCVLMLDFGGNFALHDFLKDRFFRHKECWFR